MNQQRSEPALCFQVVPGSVPALASIRKRYWWFVSPFVVETCTCALSCLRDLYDSFASGMLFRMWHANCYAAIMPFL